MAEKEYEDIDLFAEPLEDKEDLSDNLELEASQEQDEGFIMPSKFEGKDLEEVVQSYMELEKRFGSKNDELSDLRKLTDEIVKRGLDQPVPETVKQEDEPNREIAFDDLVDKPSAVIEKAISDNPRLRALESEMLAGKQQAAREYLEKRHENPEEMISDPQFVDWVVKSQTRARMFKHANDSYDAETIADMLDDYTRTVKVEQEVTTQERDNKVKADLKKAITEKGSSGADAAKRKPRFKRSELIRLKIEQPARYAAMSDEIKEAYADNRVI